jgi:hypothetical protein
MMHIKRFIDKVSAMESKQNKDIVIPMIDARGLRDDIAKLLADLHLLTREQKKDEVIQVELTGGSFK